MENVLGFGAKDIGQAAGHAGTKIQAEWAEDQDDATGHVFATVLANAFDHGERATIADGKAFAGAARDEKLARRGAVENRVAGEHVAATRSVGASRDGDGAAGQAFANVIVGFAV